MKMTVEQHLLVRAMEECGEIAQRISKAMVFGMSEVHPDEHVNPKKLTNRERIIEEYNDLIGVLQMLHLDVRDDGMIGAKIVKVYKYIDYSRSLGLVAEEQP